MIVRFNSRGAGGGSGPANYLMGKDRNRGGARVLRGDLEQTKEVIDSLSFARNYTSGCLSFAEENIPEHRKDELMDSFESTIFKGLDRDQYEITWIEHKDKGRLELNFLIANVDLSSGKRYQPYYDKAERPLVDSWQTFANALYNFVDPNAPERAAALTHSRDLPRDTLKASQAITDGLLFMAESGLVTSRKDVLFALKRHGFEVARESEKFISVKSPGGGKNLRLKGGIYERNFKSGKGVREDIEARSREYKAEREQRIQQAKSIYQSASRRKLESNNKRYKKPPVKAVQDIQKNQSVIANNPDINRSIGGDVPTKDNQSFGIDGDRVERGSNVGDLRANSNVERHDLLPTNERINKNDRIRATTNASIGAVTARVRASIYQFERTTGQYSQQFKHQSMQEHTRIVERARERESVSELQAREIYTKSNNNSHSMDF
jgi:hypothetical protein